MKDTNPVAQQMTNLVYKQANSVLQFERQYRYLESSQSVDLSESAPKLETASIKNSIIWPKLQLNSNLSQLNLSNLTSWTSQDVCSLAKLISLRELRLDRARYTTYGMNNVKQHYYFNAFSPISQLTNLEILSIERSELEDYEDDNVIDFIAKLTNLRELNLSHNNLRNIMPLAACSKLIKLDLSYNHIQFSILPDALNNLTNLQELSLNNQAGYQTDEIDDNEHLYLFSVLKQLKQLTRLEIDGAEISSISGLSHLTDLTHLSLFGNTIIDYHYLYNFQKLKMLHLDHVEKEVLGPILSSLVNIEDLILTYVEGILDYLVNPSQLTKLVLDFSDKVHLQLGKFTGLTKLCITFNTMDFSITSLENLHQLQEFSARTYVNSKMIFHALQFLPKLKKIFLTAFKSDEQQVEENKKLQDNLDTACKLLVERNEKLTLDKNHSALTRLNIFNEYANKINRQSLNNIAPEFEFNFEPRSRVPNLRLIFLYFIRQNWDRFESQKEILPLDLIEKILNGCDFKEEFSSANQLESNNNALTGELDPKRYCKRHTVV